MESLETGGVVSRPSADASPSWMCNRCDHIFHDGIHYELCPRCGLRVDWVNLTRQVWACPTCFRMHNADCPAPPGCAACLSPMRLVSAHESPGTGRSKLAGLFEVSGPFSILLGGMVAAAPLLLLALAPELRWFALGLIPVAILLPLVMAVLFLADLAAGLGELRELARDLRVRVIHGFEHATSHLFEQDGVRVSGGHTERGYFELTFPDDVRALDGKREQHVAQTVTAAIARLQGGETGLAYHPRCGSSWLVALVLAAMTVAGAGVVGLFGHLTPGRLGAVTLSMLAVIVALARPFGLLLQRKVTVSTRFTAARPGAVTRRVDDTGTHYRVRVEVEL